mgnify:CR=1 FL=1
MKEREGYLQKSIDIKNYGAQPHLGKRKHLLLLSTKAIDGDDIELGAGLFKFFNREF